MEKEIKWKSDSICNKTLEEWMGNLLQEKQINN